MTCRLCNNKELTDLIDFGNQPIVHDFLQDTNSQETYYPFQIHLCEKCGLVQIKQPIDPILLYKNYFTLSNWKNQPHIPSLIQKMQKFGLQKDSKIIEIGCNDGIFLDALCMNGYKNNLGIEPAQDAFQSATSKGHQVLNNFFSEDFSEKIINQYGKFDICISRQVLEHIQNIQSFGNGLKNILKENALVVIEVPDFQANLDNLDYSFWEEHVNYFTINTLTIYLNKIGIEILEIQKILFSGIACVVYGRYTNNKREREREN